MFVAEAVHGDHFPHVCCKPHPASVIVAGDDRFILRRVPASVTQFQASTARGIALMCGASMSMVGLDVTAKLLLDTYSLSQLAMLRSIFSAAFIGWFALKQDGIDSLKTKQPFWHFLRTLLMATSMYAFFYALPQIPLATILTIAFAAPLVVTALSRPFLGEPVGAWRWGAVLVGFFGVLVVLRPDTGFSEPAAWVALFGALTYALLSLTARKLSATESTVALSFYLFLAPMFIGAIGAWFSWRTPTPLHWLMFVLCGSFGGLAFMLMNAAFRHAQAAVLVPFDYTGLIWAAGAGFLIWGEVPARATWIGAAIIVSSGLFILYRETRAHKTDLQADFPLQEALIPRVERKSKAPE